MAQAFVNDLGIYIRAGYPIVTIISSEDDRARESIDEMLRQDNVAKRAQAVCLVDFALLRRCP